MTHVHLRHGYNMVATCVQYGYNMSTTSVQHRYNIDRYNIGTTWVPVIEILDLPSVYYFYEILSIISMVPVHVKITFSTN